MDAKQSELEDRLTEILRQAAVVACQIQKQDQGFGTPHYDQTESAVHDVGQQFSRMGQLIGEQALETTCPECRKKCPVTTNQRQVRSVDGPVELIETVASCGS